jgi:hypothetical protein
MLAKGEHPRLWRRTVVFQQAVDTRAERGHEGVYVANPSPPSCLPAAGMTGGLSTAVWSSLMRDAQMGVVGEVLTEKVDGDADLQRQKATGGVDGADRLRR